MRFEFDYHAHLPGSDPSSVARDDRVGRCQPFPDRILLISTIES